VQEDYNIDEYDYSVLTKRPMDEIAGDQGSPEWKSSRKASAGGASKKNDWLAESIAKADARKAKEGKKSAAAKRTRMNPTQAREAWVGHPAKTGKKSKTARPTSASAGGVKKNS
jgi:hypothetical protein